MAISAFNEDDVRLFAICADPGKVDLEKLSDLPVSAEPPQKVKVKPPKVKEPGHSSEEGFEEAVSKYIRPKKASQASHKSSKRQHEGTASEEDLSHSAADKQRLVAETTRYIREYGLSYDPPTTRDRFVDIQKKHATVLRETQLPNVVEDMLTLFLRGLPLLEKAIMMFFPALPVRGWAQFLQMHAGYIRGPLITIWRRHFLVFAMQENPYLALGIVLCGSLAVVVAANIMGLGPSQSYLMVSLGAHVLGLENTPAPAAPQPPMPPQVTTAASRPTMTMPDL